MCLFLFSLLLTSFCCTAQQQTMVPLLFVLRASEIEVYSCEQLNNKGLCTYDEMNLLVQISLSERGLSIQKLMPLRLSSSVAVVQTKRGRTEKFFNFDWWRVLGQDDSNRKEVYVPTTRVRTLKRINSLLVCKNRYTDNVFVVETPQEVKSAFVMCVPSYVVERIQQVIAFVKNELVTLGLLTPTQSPELDTSSLPESMIDFVDEVVDVEPEIEEFSVVALMRARLEALRRKIENLFTSLW